MDSPYSHLLERARRLPQPSFKRLAVISIFEKLRSSPPPFGLDSDHGRAALSHCLNSSDAPVADEAARGICRLVTERRLEPSMGLLELQSALEGCNPKFVQVFVKAIGFVCRFVFKVDSTWGRDFESPQLHPFVKVLSCRVEEVEADLIQQVLLFVVHNKSVGLEAVSRFLRPFLMFSILWKSSPVASSSFARDLISSLLSVCCSFPTDALTIIKLLTGCLNYFSNKNDEEFRYLINCAEILVDAFVVVLKQFVGSQKLLVAAQVCGLELLETLVSLCTYLDKPRRGMDIVLELSKRLMVGQKLLGLSYLPDFAMVTVTISLILTRVEFEHEQLAVLKLLIFLIEWKTEKGYDRGELSTELLVAFPVIDLLSSPSKSIKATANYLLFALERLLLDLSVASGKTVFLDTGLPSISKPGSIPLKLLYHIWFQEQSPFQHIFFFSFICNDIFGIKEKFHVSSSWPSQLREHLSNFARCKFKSLSQSPGMPFLLSSVSSLLAMHPTIGGAAVDSLAAISKIEPKLGIPMILFILFHNKMLSNHQMNSTEILARLLELLPSLAFNSDIVPLIIQTILPMLHKDVKPILYAVAVRLLCKTWIITDRAFSTLQEFLDPKVFSDFIFERDICISVAASVRDVCKHNPDRGVDLILSVSSCIESRDSFIQALGFESLAYLCEADVVDFYTARDVLATHMLAYSSDPIVSHGICTLLRWGAMDAEAYPEDSKKVLQILWEVATSEYTSPKSLWVKARVSAFNSLSCYEVSMMMEMIDNFKKRNLQCLITEQNAEVLEAMVGFETKLIDYEHTMRRRVHKEKRVKVHKIEKLLEVLPQVMFSQGKQKFRASELPGAALLSFDFTPKDLHCQGMPKDLAAVHVAYGNSLKEISESLHVSRNVMVALLTFQSWKSFVHRWMNTAINFDTASSNVPNKSSKVANYIFKTMCKIAAESIPQVSINIALAIGALCSVVPPSADEVVSSASNFLIKWLFEYGHEYKQWSAAISLGLVCNCFHETDRTNKFKVIAALLKVLRTSKSHLVIGACGIGLGFSCQNLLTRADNDDDNTEGKTDRLTETTFLYDIIRTLSLKICQLCPSATDHLRNLTDTFPSSPDDTYTETADELPFEDCDNLDDDDVWGVAGLVLGLGNSVVAVYRTGSYDSVLEIKNMLISWIPNVDSSIEIVEVPLSIGSCLALPAVVAFCQRAELMDDDLDLLLSRYLSLILCLLDSKKSGTLHQNLLMASCIGAGSFMSCIVNDGVHSIRFDEVKHLMEILRSTYTRPFSSIIQLGGMLGVVNAFGAGAGDLLHTCSLPTPWQINYEQESDIVRGPILSSPICEALTMSMVQEMFLLAKGSKDQIIQRYTAWAVSYLRERWYSEFQNVVGTQIRSDDSSSSSLNFAEDSIVWNLCLWLRDINSQKTGEIIHATTVATVLRCLSNAPRLPPMDWGAIIRRCMRYEAQCSDKISIREECIEFSLSHAKKVNTLLLLLDDLTRLSRFRTLDPNLQSTLLLHLPELTNIFTGLRLETFFEDLLEYLSSTQRSSLRVSLWKGIHRCLVEAPKELIHMPMMEKCMERLFCLLPEVTCNGSREEDGADSLEWLEAIAGLSKAREVWLLDFLQVHLYSGENQFMQVEKRISAKARLVRNGCFPISELGKMKAYILDAPSQGIWWSVIVEVIAAMSNAGIGIKKEWLLDALEISCITEYPSTALRFVGLLSGSCSDYMPLLIVDPIAVLSDLPVTLPSLLSDDSWSCIAETLAEKLLASTEHVCRLAARSAISSAGGDMASSLCERSEEAAMSAFLAHVAHRTCVSLKEYLPFEKQLKLTNLEISVLADLPVPSLRELR